MISKSVCVCVFHTANWQTDSWQGDDDDAEDGCGCGLIKEGQVGGTIRSS